MSSVYHEFATTVARAPELPFLHIPAAACRAYSDDAIDFTYQDAFSKIEQLAGLYRERAYGSPQRVALALENRPDFFLHWLALNSLGCSVIPISTDMQPEEIAYFLEHGEASLLISVPDAMALMSRACERLQVAIPLVSSDALQQLPTATGECDNLEPGPDSECALLYTSGSTGKPKGCQLNNTYFTAFGEWYRDLGGLGKIDWGKERLLTPLPLGHMNAMAVSTTGMIMSAGCIVQLDRFHSRTWWQSVRESGASIIHYLGVLPAILLELPPADDDFSKQVRFGFGAGVNPKHHARFEQRFGFPLIESWAMTECGAGGCITANTEPRHVGTCCFGKPNQRVEHQLVDESKQAVSQGLPGELRVRARGDDPQRGFFSGYLKNPEETANVWEDGWLNTGDVAREDEDGSLYFVDRRKNIIRRSGENISALDVETTLSQNQNISEALVCAIPDDLRGDEVAACVIPADANAVSEAAAADIVRQCLNELAYYKVPGYVIFCTELPRTASNKPRRADVKTMARQRVESGECWDTRFLKNRKKSGQVSKT